jgi:16S rRNA (guanine527-N7)-methyltransferase
MEIIEKYFVDFSPRQKEQLNALLPLYKEWNEKINVISRKDIDNFYLHHVLHSLTITTQFEFEKGASIMDLGCGGGFPGVPLAIFFPETEFYMVDSINKKLNVVKEIAATIGLNNITVKHTRAEDIKDRKFDTVVSRAVAPLKELWQWSKPLIKRIKTDNENVPNGLICLKGGDLTKEIQESGCKPYVWDIDKVFPEEYFKEKYMLYQPFK